MRAPTRLLFIVLGLPACGNATDASTPDATPSMALSPVNKGLDDLGDSGAQVATLASADKIALCEQTQSVFSPAVIAFNECALKALGDSVQGDVGVTTQATCSEQTLCLTLVDAGLATQAGIDAAFMGDSDASNDVCAAAGSADYTGCDWSPAAYVQCVNDVANTLTSLSPVSESQCQSIDLATVASGVAVPASCVAMPAECPTFAFDPRAANSVAPLYWAAASDAATDAADARADAHDAEAAADAADADGDAAATDSAIKDSEVLTSEAPQTSTTIIWPTTGVAPNTTTLVETTGTGGPVVEPVVDTSGTSDNGGGCGGSSDPDAGSDSTDDSSSDGGGCGGSSSSNDDNNSGGCGDGGGCGSDSSDDSGGGCGDSGGDGGGDCGGGGGGSDSCSIAQTRHVTPGRQARMIASVFGRSQMYAGLGFIWLAQIVRRRRSKTVTVRAANPSK